MIIKCLPRLAWRLLAYAYCGYYGRVEAISVRTDRPECFVEMRYRERTNEAACPAGPAGACFGIDGHEVKLAIRSPKVGRLGFKATSIRIRSRMPLGRDCKDRGLAIDDRCRRKSIFNEPGSIMALLPRASRSSESKSVPRRVE